MKLTQPEVFMIAETSLDRPEFQKYLEQLGAANWGTDAKSDSEELIEIAGRLCYRSFLPGLNPNVTKIREGNEAYLKNIIESGHGSVLEHASVSFLFKNVSRVFTHELVTHRVGIAKSQESMRYVRLEEISFWFPEWAKEDQELMEHCVSVLKILEEHQQWMAEHFKLNESKDFSNKKHKTSFMRRFAPDGVSTAILWTANLRTLRHLLELRTDKTAEEEIRLVFGRVAEICKENFPIVFQDFESSEGGEWKPTLRSKI